MRCSARAHSRGVGPVEQAVFARDSKSGTASQCFRDLGRNGVFPGSVRLLLTSSSCPVHLMPVSVRVSLSRSRIRRTGPHFSNGRSSSACHRRFKRPSVGFRCNRFARATSSSPRWSGSVRSQVDLRRPAMSPGRTSTFPRNFSLNEARPSQRRSR
jgi:hypothetical protein